jgi:WD40-like Beta Propeller Repeat
MRPVLILLPVLAVSLCLCCVSVGGTQSDTRCSNTRESVDPVYGSKITELVSPGHNNHNLYYHRDPWNADNSYLLGIDSDSDSRNWSVILYDGRGCFIKRLFTIDQFDWRLVWDRHDPNTLYTWRGSDLYRFDVTNNRAQLLKSFASQLRPNGPSLNQTGDRILVATLDNVFHSYHLPDMGDERSFSAMFPAGCRSSWKDERYIGFRNYISTTCNSTNPPLSGLYIYNDTGETFHVFANTGGGGHYDFSPDGKLAYFRMWGGGRGQAPTPLEIHVVNLDGTNDRVLYSVPQARAKSVQNLHLSWPDRVSTWFVAGFFPFPGARQDTYAPPFDEVAAIDLSGNFKGLARTQTNPGRGAAFWAQPLASPSADGSRISFNSNRTGNIQQYILWTPSNP